MKCCRCEAEATYDAPEPFCDEHWARWWAGMDPEDTDPGDMTMEEKEEMYQACLRIQKMTDEVGRE